MTHLFLASTFSFLIRVGFDEFTVYLPAQILIVLLSFQINKMMMNNYSSDRWLTERFNGPEAYLWFQARKLILLSKPTTSALDLIDTDHTTELDLPEISGNSDLIQEETNTKPKHVRWTENTNNSVRILVDNIITRWNPQYLDKKSLSHRTLHNSLIDMPCKHIPRVFGKKL
jgi:hypothetical protein